MKTVLLDNGHGKETPGKRSPIWSDGSQLFEWEFNRDIVRRIHAQIPLSVILVPEDEDISLAERCRRANQYDDAILISIHANAGGGTGWEAYTTKGTTKSDEYATILYEEAEKELTEFKMRKDMSDGDPDKEDSLYITKNVKCPAVLTESLFMDTERDCRFLMSDEGRQRIADFHVRAIHRMLGTQGV